MVSSEESETRQSHKRDKHKKRRKIEMDEGIEPDMEAIFNSMALAFEVLLFILLYDFII